MFIKEITVGKVPSLNEFATNANGLDSEVKISKGEYHVVANSVLGLLALGLRIGDKVTLSSEDETQLSKLESFLS